MIFETDIILASASPRRSQLLRQIGVSFLVKPADVDETIGPGTNPESAVKKLASNKAQKVAGQHPAALVIGADTIVVLGNKILEKPESPEHAMSMLRDLSGETHTVYTGLALESVQHGISVSDVSSTRVTMDTIQEEDIQSYVASGATMDKAGSYGIQDRGACFVSHIEGDFYTVMGFPLNQFYRLVRKHCSELICFDSKPGDIVEVTRG